MIFSLFVVDIFTRIRINGKRKYMTLGAGVRVNIIGIDFSYI